MERSPHLGKNSYFQETEQENLNQPKPSVQNQHQGHRNIQEGAPGLQYGNADKQAHSPGTGIAHHQSAGCGIIPQISKYTDTEQ